MSVKTLETLKSYFNTGDKPTESQFVDLIDSCYNNMESEALSLQTSAVGYKHQTLQNITLVDDALYLIQGQILAHILMQFTLVCKGNDASDASYITDAFKNGKVYTTMFTINVYCTSTNNNVTLGVVLVHYFKDGLLTTDTQIDYIMQLNKIQRIR